MGQMQVLIMEIELTQQEWDLIRTIRAYREIRKKGDKVLEETLKREAEDYLVTLIPSENMKALIEENRAERSI